ncbi:hypothetical protein CYMTET_43482 [Cymbomonas tetramitiformis]|uniref:RNA-directed DNA polymerase n=1 Tax=Cymbomonas tetramitiformis TaxID=36881 RepID=A0AAE0F089_9CHLO|nr:hypothetical protein CYMTET_43482 [Cymbomonas tetramitiformis]
MAATRTELSQELPERRCVEERVKLEQAAYRKAANAPVCTTAQRLEAGVAVRLKPHASGVVVRLQPATGSTVETCAAYRQHLENQGTDVASVRRHWKYRKQREPQRQVRQLLRVQRADGRLRPTIRALERHVAEGANLATGSRKLELWRAGRRRRSRQNSLVSKALEESATRSGLEECRKCLERLKRVREYNRRRREVLDREAGRPVQVARTRNEKPKSEKVPGPSRPWLTRGKARLASGRSRRAWLSGEGKLRRTTDLEAQYKREDRPVPLTEIERRADFHAFVQESRSQEQREFLEKCEFSHRDEQVRGRIAAKRAAATIQVAVYPPDYQDPGVVRQAVFTGLLADACTWPLPDSDSDSETPIADLGCIMQNGDVSPGWCESLAAMSSLRNAPRGFSRHSKKPTLLLFWAWIGGVRVKVLVDSGASTNIIAADTVRRLKGLQPVRHEQAMRVRVADGRTYDANSCVRPRLQAETSKGTYGQQVELRVMPIDLKVDVILGGPWLADLSPVTLDYKNWGSVRFSKGKEEVVITGCSPGSPEPNRAKDSAMALVQGVILSQRRARRDLRALRAKEECAFVVYLAPDGSFGATAFDSGGRDSGEDSPNDVVAGLASEPSSDGETVSDDPNGALAESPSESTSAPEPSLHPLASDTGSDSDGFWAEYPRDNNGSGAGSSGTEGSQHLERVAALAADVRPAGFVGAVEEDSSTDPLSFFASKREANGAFALLPAAVRRQAIEDHAAGKPATWHAQAAAALRQGRQLVAEGRPRVKRRQVRWSDQVAAVAPPVEREPTKAQAADAAPAVPSVPVLEPREDEIDESVSPEMWQQLRDLEKEFEDVICTELPESVQAREYKASVRLRPDWQGNPLYRKGYKLSQEGLRQLRLQLDELLAKGYMRPSASPWGCPVLMVPKPSNPKELRLVIDYRQINEITVKDKYPLPDVQSLLDDLQGATVFSTMDALWGFWQIPMSADDVEKTAMTTHFGAYEWLVMPMGLSNSPSTWQRMMTQYLGHLPFCRVFVDDIMIFSADDPGEGGAPGRNAHQVHLDHLRQVLEACRKNSVYLKKSKVKLCKRAVRFLGHVVDRDGCRPQQDKVASVRDWPDLETVTHVRQFLGMCGFYRRYIQNFADLAYPLTRLTKSGVEWAWGKEEKAAFNRLKAALISSPTLALPDQRGAADGSRPFCVQTDASGVALGGVLMQDFGQGLQPIAFESRQFSSAEQNYHAGERELCAIHHCTAITWRHYLIFTSFKLIGDHKPLQWLFAPARELSRRQARWYEDLVEVGVHQMEHVPGWCLVVPDAQSRRPDYKELSAREGLKEKGIVDRSTDGPRVSKRTDVPSKEIPEKVDEDEDPASVLDAVFEYSDSEDESVPPTSPPVVIGELTHLNGLTWVETPDLWSDAADTLRVGEKALEDAESLAAVTRSAQVRERESATPVGHHSNQATGSHYDRVVDRQDWRLIKERFDEIVAQYGPFDVDAWCDSMGVNRQVEHFWTDCLKEQWRGNREARVVQSAVH